MKINCYAAHSQNSELKSFAYEAPKLGPKDALIKVTHCGICHSDLHLINNDWGISQFPLVPGHEVIGEVCELGSEVNHLRTGDRVGIGWQCGACFECEACISGQDNLCISSGATAVGHYGGFAEYVVSDSRFAFKIPTKLSSTNAAPLLCGGITVFSPFFEFEVRPTMRVGVIGIGGLGHLALQFARAWGCEVIAFSSSADKEVEAKRFGAHHFASSQNAESWQHWSKSLDFLISTVNADLDWPAYLNLLRPNGRFCFVGVPPNPVALGVMPLIAERLSVSGSPIGSRNVINKMLEFTERHNIQALTESMPLADVNLALAKLKRNQARYRIVLEVSQ